jgi:hypothetical protein
MVILSNNSNSQTEAQSFAEQGYLDDRIYASAQKMNSEFAFFNCPLVAYKTAYLLEKGIVPKMDILFSNLPRPMSLAKMVRAWSALFAGLGPHRNYVLLQGYSKETLEFKMLNYGKGTHAIVGGVYKASVNMGLVSGHCWNYVFSKEGKFIILDSYSSSYYKLGLEKPVQYFDEYQNSFDAIVFFNKRT